MTTALTLVRGRSDDMLSRFIKGRGRSESDRFYEGATGSNFGPTRQDIRASEDARNYERNIGWVYAALRPIEHRIAGLPWVVGRMLKTPKKDYKPTFGRRLLTPYELSLAPDYVLRKWGLPHTSMKDFSRRLDLIMKTVHSEAAGFEIIESHPVLELLTDPNERMIQHSLMACSVASLKLTGKLYWWLAKSTRPGKKWDLWPIPSNWVSPKSENGRIDEGWYFHLPFRSGDPILVPADRVIFFNYVDPANPFHSLAPATAGHRAIATDEMIQQSQQSGFENGIWPGLAVITGDVTSPEGTNLGKAELEDFQIRQIERRINDLYKGSSKHKKLIVLDKVIADIKEITRTNQEMDWMNSSVQTKARIFQIFGVNAIVVGEIEDANRATAVVADESFLQNVINPDACLIGEVANDNLLPLFEGGNSDATQLWLEQARTHDPEQVRENVKILATMRGIEVDEARALMGMPPMENDMGKVLPYPMTIMLDPSDGSMEQSRLDKIELEAEVVANAEDRTQESHDATIDAMSREAQQKPQNGNDKSKSLHQYANQWLKVHTRREKAMAATFEQFFNLQAATAAENYQRLGVKLLKQTPEQAAEKILPNEPKWTIELKDAVEPHIQRSAITGAEIEARRIRSVGKAYVKADPDEFLIELPDDVLVAIKETIRQTLRQSYWREITATSRAALAGAIRKAQTEGDNLPQTVKRIKESLGGDAGKIRAVAAARTETTNALNSGTDAIIEDLVDDGIASGKQWLATVDQFTRDPHLVANGQKADESGLYTVGDEQCPYPGWYGLSAKNRVNCRCTEIAVFE